MSDLNESATPSSPAAPRSSQTAGPEAPGTGDPAVPTRERLAILWSFARPYLRVLVFGLVLALAVSAMGLASPMVTKWVLDTLEVDGSLRDPVLVLAALMVLGAVIGWFQWVMLGTLAENIVYDARRRMILRYLGARVFALLGRSPGELVTRVTSDTVLLNQAASSSVIGLINGSIMLIGSLILMGRLDMVLLLTTMAAVAVVVVLFIVLMPRISKVEEKAQAALSGLGSELEGTVRAIKTVKSSGAEPRRFAGLMRHVGESRRFSLTSVRIQATAWTVAMSGLEIAVIMVLALGAYRVSIGEITVSTLIAFLLYVWGLSGPIMELTQNLTTLQSGMAAAGRIRQIEQMEVESPGADVAIAAGRRDAADADAAERELRRADRGVEAAKPAVPGTISTVATGSGRPVIAPPAAERAGAVPANGGWEPGRARLEADSSAGSPGAGPASAAAERPGQAVERNRAPEGEPASSQRSASHPEPAGSDHRDRQPPVLEMRAVTARYAPGMEPAVRDIELVVPRHGHLALVGSSGAGKTTMLSLMLRFLEPESGELRLDGVPYGALTHAQVRSAFAYVEQETPVVPGTIRDNLLFTNPGASEESVDEVLDRLFLREKVEALPQRLDTPLSETNVSGGQRQRISLARALLADPRVLLLDEATAQVDGITENAIHETIAERAGRAAVVTIAHRLSTVIDADQILVMDGGRIVDRGTHDELLGTSPLYRDLVAALRINAG
ncbi:ABC transporter ATP-binding protein [Sediminivirga luteola]|uniref:ABC transporter ATP-binding protein n=1 Tax=Sediminivirga luteola TaxID=1774748 RepID=UPI002412C698|nr:ABC transporter ATP-binding protein [Sediminivirga luteola]